MEKIENRYGLAASYLNVGIICTEQGDLMRALRYCNLAMDIVHKFPITRIWEKCTISWLI